MAQNQAPPTSIFCPDPPAVTTPPTIRFVGGITLESQVDPTKMPGECGISLDLVGKVQSALAPFQPFLTLLDAVAGLAQCFLLLTDVVTNPFKIPDLLKCIPGLVGKINQLLALIPVFPQGIQAFVTFVVDVVRFARSQIDCALSVLESIQEQFDQLAQIAAAINETDDVAVKAGLQEMFDCGVEEANRQAQVALSALAPIARVLCTVRALLALIPGGRAVQAQLAFPDPSQIVDVSAAISALESSSAALEAAEGAIVALTAGLGVLAPAEPGFTCPLDSLADEAPTEPTVAPEISSVIDPNTGLPPVLVALAPTDPDRLISILGSGFSAESKVFWSTSQVPAEKVQLAGPERLNVFLPADLLTVVGEYQLSVVNEPPGGAGAAAFSGLSGPDGEEAVTGVEVSNLVALEVT